MLLFISIYLLIVNIISFSVMYHDKQLAIKQDWRIPESQLLFLCLSGGFIGTFLAMKYIRHKTKHWQFHTAVIISALLWQVILVYVMLSL